jgi:hypothetical protein
MIKTEVLAQAATNAAILVILEQRKDFWESMGFSGG